MITCICQNNLGSNLHKSIMEFDYEMYGNFVFFMQNTKSNVLLKKECIVKCFKIWNAWAKVIENKVDQQQQQNKTNILDIANKWKTKWKEKRSLDIVHANFEPNLFDLVATIAISSRYAWIFVPKHNWLPWQSLELPISSKSYISITSCIQSLNKQQLFV